MFCLGDQNIRPTYLEAEAAELFIFTLFGNDFLQRFPGGFVTRQLEYRNTQLPRNPAISEVLRAMSEDFRRWANQNDYRKCDMMGISSDGSVGEILEVTTWRNRASAKRQVRDKLDTLINTVNRNHSHLHISWRRSSWLPSGLEMYLPLPSTNHDELIRYICYEPTYRAVEVGSTGTQPRINLNTNVSSLFNGTVLYEVHAIERRRVPVRVRLPQRVRNQLQQFYQINRPLILQSPGELAHQFVLAHPEAARAIGELFLIGVAQVVIVIAIVTYIDLVPGDEVAFTGFALQVLKEVLRILLQNRAFVPA